MTAPPRLALTKPEAAAALGVSVDTLERHILGDLRVVRRGRLVLIPIRELERWLERSAALTLDRRPCSRLGQP
ncbi:MAG: helix-turn-helix domain-containing protein [Solirubrobacteraceae bacterium]